MKGIKRSFLVYDIFCQWWINFLLRVNHSPYLSIPEGMKLIGGIGDFHVKGNIIDCFARWTLLFIIGSGVIDGEILETLWSVLNETSRSAKGSMLAHWSKILDDHMNHSNWKKLIGMVSTLIQKLKRAKELVKSSEVAYQKLTDSVSKVDLEKWSKGEQKAQKN
ncbi:hypothetical protein L208DRAFT_1272393 [Tricholoma matsutake]|nr:hypothetical protein L208DRAFT_1272393 [Tricholoma matsutake 945]